jgi:hypothetical protein
MSGHSACPQAQAWGLTLVTPWRHRRLTMPRVPCPPERAIGLSDGGSVAEGRSAWRARCGTRASSAALHTACCWMTANRSTTHWHTTSGVCAQRAASSGSPAGNGREVATVPLMSHIWRRWRPHTRAAAKPCQRHMWLSYGDSSSSNALASCRSAVSKPSVNQP